MIRCMQTLDIDEAKQFIFDHRKLNGSRQKFDLYFKYANMYVKHIEELTSVNARRHSTVMYLSSHWSVPQFMLSVEEFIKEKHPDVIDQIEVPSQGVVNNAFLPANPYVGTSLSTHRINVVRKLTTKQLHKNHIDTHACNVLRRSVKDVLFTFSRTVEKTRLDEFFSLQFYRDVEHELRNELQLDSNKKICIRQVYRFISCDDKAKIPIGEPNYPISTGSRQRANIVPANSNSNLTQVLDHDFSKASITPSIELDMFTPTKRDSSWWDGSLHFVLHDSVFYPSNGWFHAVNMIMRLLNEGACAAKENAPTTLKSFLDLDEKTRKKILFYVPYYLVLSTDGEFILYMFY